MITFDDLTIARRTEDIDGHFSERERGLNRGVAGIQHQAALEEAGVYAEGMVAESDTKQGTGAMGYRSTFLERPLSTAVPRTMEKRALRLDDAVSFGRNVAALRSYRWRRRSTYWQWPTT